MDQSRIRPTRTATGSSSPRLVQQPIPATTALASLALIADEDAFHGVVNHRSEEWVRGDVHPNTVENVLSLFKRSAIGSYHQVSVKHLPVGFVNSMCPQNGHF
jgi:hypothetical protein